MTAAYGNIRPPRSSSLVDVLDLILDKGIVIDAYVRVSLVGIELLTVDARIVIASVDTYLRFAQAVNRLELGGGESTQSRGLPEVIGEMEQGGAEKKTSGALSGVGDAIERFLPGKQDGDGHRQRDREPAQRDREPAQRDREPAQRGGREREQDQDEGDDEGDWEPEAEEEEEDPEAADRDDSDRRQRPRAEDRTAGGRSSEDDARPAGRGIPAGREAPQRTPAGAR